MTCYSNIRNMFFDYSVCLSFCVYVLCAYYSVLIFCVLKHWHLEYAFHVRIFIQLVKILKILNPTLKYRILRKVSIICVPHSFMHCVAEWATITWLLISLICVRRGRPKCPLVPTSEYHNRVSKNSHESRKYVSIFVIYWKLLTETAIKNF